jgi:peptidyl-prolyl cis-trans isomerase D
MMRAFRAQTKWVFWILAISFIGWLALSQVLDIIGPTGRVVLKVNGQEIAAQDFERMVRQTEEQYRAQTGNSPATREERRDLENQVVEQIVRDILLRDEYDRLGIDVSREEIIEAARNSPPPELMQQQEFQTDGRPDLGKWQRYLASAGPQFMLAIEARYRELLPQVELQEYLTADVYLSDAKLWRAYKDQHDSIRVGLVGIWPEMLPDSGISVRDAELRRYLDEHEDDFERPAVAFMSYVALDRRTNAADSAAAAARARDVRAEAARDQATFERLVTEVSADSATAGSGGDLGWFKRNDPGFAPRFMSAVRALRPGQTSAPILTEMGYEIVRLDEARGDSLRARRIVVPIDLAGDHLDAVESRADSLDRIAADLQTPAALDTAAARLDVPIAGARLREGDRLTLGRHVIPNVSVWAFETPVGETSPVFEGKVAYYVFRLDSLHPAGVPRMEDIREPLSAAVRREKKLALAVQRGRELAERMRSSGTLAAAAAAAGVQSQTLGPFTRVTPPPALAREPELLGAAFGLAVGGRVGPVDGEHGVYFLELLSRKTADSTAWLAQKEQQAGSLIAAARQARVSQFMNGLRASADVLDRRQEVTREMLRSAPEGPAPGSPLGF